MAARQAALFVTHGGGPMPLLGTGSQQSIADFMRSASKLLPQKPRAVVCVTAHWETDGQVMVSSAAAPPMLYDYYGFPPEAYKVQYPAPGDPELAGKVMDLIRNAGFPASADSKRGFDHGTFVPLKLMLPEADIPVVQVSVMSHLDPAAHVAVGRALAPLRDDNVLILGSGSSFHNMGLFRQKFTGSDVNQEGVKAAQDFDSYLKQACCDSTPEQRVAMLEQWESAPGGKLSHPREEHLIPLHVVVGAAGSDAGQQVMSDDSMGFACSSFVFRSAPPSAAA